jgi:hypothetical protein
MELRIQRGTLFEHAPMIAQMLILQCASRTRVDDRPIAESAGRMAKAMLKKGAANWVAGREHQARDAQAASATRTATPLPAASTT